MDGTERIQELVDDYVANLLERESCDDPDDANDFDTAALDALDELYPRYGDAGLDRLATLLSHQDPAVRCEVACILLRDRHEKAKAVLEDFASRPETGLNCAGARATLGRWDAGNWKPFWKE
ncbi:hypothetical protein [Aeoliella mucimassa]|uniref:hypothetical protein n=1 Tax=Aeoliella mucimassa TaxID=2527972 RepID=UPI0011AA4760|nr:hypothetical protein [Aeoliella mucimassa]